MDIALTGADLLTVAGASAAALILAQFAKALFNLGATAIRTVTLATGLIIVVGATFTSGAELSFQNALLAVIVGAQAGLAANAGFDAFRSGIGYEVSEAAE